MTGPMVAGIGGVLSASNNQGNTGLFAGSTSSHGRPRSRSQH